MALTWRNVDAPDFSPSMRGYETFSRLLENAFGGAQAGLGRYDQALDRRYNNNIALQFAGIQDPEQAKRALAELGSLGGNQRLSGATIENVSGRPNELITQALNQENLDWTGYQHDRVQGFDKAEDAAAPLVADRLAAYASGKGPEWEAAHPQAFQGLSMAARTSMFGQGQDARSKDLSITGQGITNEGGQIQNQQGRFNIERGQWEFGNQKVDRDEARAASAFVSNYLSTGHDGSDIDGALSSSGLSGPAQMLARQMVGGGVGGGFSGGPGASGGGAGGVGGDPTRVVTGGGNGNLGIGQVPPSVQTLGQAVEFGKSLNNQGQESSAMGLYQITQSTMEEFGEKALGKDWRNAPFNAQTQDKIAEQIFNSSRGSAAALHGRWVSLSPQDAEQVRRMPWQQARQYIAQGESGGNPAALLIGQTLANQGSKNQFMQGNANSIAEPIQAALTDTTSLVDVASNLVGDKGPLKGANRSWVMQKIQQIQAMGRSGQNSVQISPAAAAVILQRSVKSTSGNWLPDNNNSDAIGGELAIDRDSAKSYVDQIRSGDYQRQVATNTGIQFRGQQAETAKAAWDNARSQLQRAQARAAANPHFDRSILGRLTIAEAAAAEQYRAAISQQGNAAQAGGGMGATALPPPAAPTSGPPVSFTPSPMPSWAGGPMFNPNQPLPFWARPPISLAPSNNRR